MRRHRACIAQRMQHATHGPCTVLSACAPAFPAAAPHAPHSPHGQLVERGHILLQELPRHLHHEAGTVARVVVGRTGAAVLHAAQGGQSLHVRGVQCRSGYAAVGVASPSPPACVRLSRPYPGPTPQPRPLTFFTTLWLLTFLRLAMKPTCVQKRAGQADAKLSCGTCGSRSLPSQAREGGTELCGSQLCAARRPSGARAGRLTPHASRSCRMVSMSATTGPALRPTAAGVSTPSSAARGRRLDDDALSTG